MTNPDANFLRGQKHLTRRYRAEQRFQLMGRAAIAVSLTFLVFMVSSIFWQGKGALVTTKVALTVNLSTEMIDPANIKGASFDKVIKLALRMEFPEVTKRKQKKNLYALVSSDAGFQLRDQILKNPTLLGKDQTIWVSASDDVDMLMKGHIDRNKPQNSRRLWQEL